MAEPNGNGTARVRVSFETVIGWIVAALLAYAATTARVAVLEAQYGRIVQDISEIKADVRTLTAR